MPHGTNHCIQRTEEQLRVELGVGFNTLAIIKYPFWQFAFTNSNATYAAINKGASFSPEEIADRSICIDEDISKVLGILQGRV